MSKLNIFYFILFTVLHYASGSCCGEGDCGDSNGPLNDYTVSIKNRIGIANKEQMKVALACSRSYSKLKVEEAFSRLSIGNEPRIRKLEKSFSKCFKDCRKMGIVAFCRDLSNYILSDLSRTPDDVIREVTAEVTGEDGRVSIIELQIPDPNDKEGKLSSPSSPSSSSSSVIDSPKSSKHSQTDHASSKVKSSERVSEGPVHSPKSSSLREVGSESRASEKTVRSSDKVVSPSERVAAKSRSGDPGSARRSSTRTAGASESTPEMHVRSPEDLSGERQQGSSRLQSQVDKASVEIEAIVESEHMIPDGRPVKEGKFVSGDLVQRDELNEETILLVARSITLLIEDELNNQGLTIDTADRDVLNATKASVFNKFETSLAKRVREDPYIAVSSGVEKFLWSYLYYAEVDINNSGNDTES
ncbi:hypothetical protein FG379_003556 [Cryptosporidium bovis]|uniref:uncharacterized protein n=1 Tax=Cryptosporidium bovis TaxID=310047 RepID=UPI00351A2A46|nr:hypothetical protein FG379_003556 [Cryptosporidium bovis]